MTIPIQIEFPDKSNVEQTKLAQDLYNKLQYESLDANLLRRNPDAMDVGTIVSIALGAPAVVVLAKGLAEWMVRKNQTSIILQKDGVRLEVKNASNEGLDQLIKKITALLRN